MDLLTRDIHCDIIKQLTLRPTSDKPDVRTMGRLAATCRYFREMIDINGNSPFILDKREKTRRTRIIRLRHNNPLEIMLEDPNVDINCLSDHECLTFDTISKYYITKRFNIKTEISTNPNITIEMLLDIIKMCTNTLTCADAPIHARSYIHNRWFKLNNQSVITIDELRRNNLDFSGYNSICMMTVQDYIRQRQECVLAFTLFMASGKIHPEDPKTYKFEWDYEILVKNQNIPVEVLFAWRREWGITEPSGSEIYRFCDYRTPAHLRAEYENLIIKLHNSGDLHKLTDNKDAEIFKACSSSFSIKTILKHLDFPWQWERVSHRCGTSFTVKYAVNNPHLPWRWDNMHLIVRTQTLSERVKYHEMYEDGTLTMQIILDTTRELNYQWNWYKILVYERISVDDIIRYGPIGWPIGRLLSSRNDVTLQTTHKYPKVEWCYPMIANSVKIDDL